MHGEEVISGEQRHANPFRGAQSSSRYPLDLAVIPQISDQIIFAFTRRLVIDEKAFTS